MLVNRRRPIWFDLNPLHLFLPALVSILHRISGVVVFFLIPGLLWMLQESLASETQFLAIQSVFSLPWLLLLFAMGMGALLFHLLAGIRHMLMDLHIGESKIGGKVGASIVLILFLLLFIWLGWILWNTFVLSPV